MNESTIYVMGEWAHDIDGNPIEAGTYEMYIVPDEEGVTVLTGIEDPGEICKVSANEMDQILTGFSRWLMKKELAAKLAQALGALCGAESSVKEIFNDVSKRTEIAIYLDWRMHLIAPPADACKLLYTELGKALMATT